MAAPTSYTELDLKKYMHDVLGADELAKALNWSVAGSDYDTAVDEALLVYGVDAISAISGRDNIRKLRAIARVELWRIVVSRTAGDYDVKLDNDSYSRAQVHAHALGVFAREQMTAKQLGVGAYSQRQYATGATHLDPRQGYWNGRTS